MPPCVHTDTTGAPVSRADSTQDNLGWNNFIKGKIAKEWCQAQAQYCRDIPDIPAHNSITQSTSIFVDVWNARNAHLHSEMENTNNNVLDIQVQKAYALEDSMSTSDRLLFYMDLTEHLKSSSKSKQLWLESVKIAVHDFTIVNKRMPSQCVITDFFHNTPTDTQNTPQEQQQWHDADIAYVPALI
eukprot:515897-Ditylum_brightwellii.AAC.1